tara:strand:- start:682 stop:1011 length:330 start_codon:yes stop_codon:yes gene_type:complete
MTSSFNDSFGPRALGGARDDYFDIREYAAADDLLKGAKSFDDLFARLDEMKERGALPPARERTRKEKRIERKGRRAARRGDKEKFEKLLNRAKRLGRKEARRARRSARD